MFVTNYFYRYAINDYQDHIEIPNLPRNKHAVDYYCKMFSNELANIKLQGKTAFLLASGTTVNQSESQDLASKDKGQFDVSVQKPTMVIKGMTAYSLHKYIKSMDTEFSYASINSNTCASSMFSIYEAEQLITYQDFDHVVIIADDRVSFNTIRIFKEHNIPVKVSDGFACIVLSKEPMKAYLPTITDTKWTYHYDNNPFLVSAEGYSKVNTSSDIVKGHGTGTLQNQEAEQAILNGREYVMYKNNIGHAQGASALLEVCIMLDDPISISKSVLCLASGLGGFYGSCKLTK